MREFTYQFETENGSFSYVHDSGAPLREDDDYPDWTQLNYKQCEGCTYMKSDRCPVAVRLMEPSQLLGKLVSYDKVKVTVIGPERTYSKDTTAQEALSALFGLVMSTSGCPSFDFLKGLGWYHLPFATFEETVFRAVSAYFITHYLREKVTQPDELVRDLQALYEQINRTNQGISQRLRYGVAPETDSPMNAIVILDSFGSLVPMSVESGLDEMRGIFL